MQSRILVVPGLLGLLAGSLAAQPPQGGGFRGGFDPSAFIARLDANGNGQIDPEESQGRAGFFLQRIAENDPDLDLSKPVPLERIEKAFTAARERREAERGQSEGGGNSGDRSRGETSSSSRSSSAKDELQVPGFGEPSDLPGVPGFGLLAEATGLVRVTQADLDEASRRFGYYDRNKDGFLDQEEMQRSWSRDYQNYDSNRDGKLTLDELAVRYAKRRVEQEQQQRSASSSSSRSSSSERRDSSSSSSQRRDSGDRRGGWFGRREDESSRDSRGRSSKESESDLPLRLSTDAERLVKLGAPSWFREKDSNGDGQVAMAEYSETWTDDKLADFAGYDLNKDGFITPQECLKATKAGTGRSSASSSRSSYASRSRSGYSRSTPSREASSSRSVARDEPEDKPEDKEARGGTSDKTSQDSQAQSSESQEEADSDEGDPADEAEAAAAAPTAKPKTAPPAEIDPRYLSYAQGRVKQFDANKDGLLQPNEWANMSKSPAGADTNGDELITAQELAIFVMQQ